jgi:hypothetical protein
VFQRCPDPTEPRKKNNLIGKITYMLYLSNNKEQTHNIMAYCSCDKMASSNMQARLCDNRMFHASGWGAVLVCYAVESVGKGNTRDSYCPIHSFIAECGINQKLG